MNSELIDRLHPWLLTTLSNSGLDPKDMTDYVVSLLTVPGSRAEVRERCISELNEFLESNTVGFVDAMFSEIERLQSNTGFAPQQQQQQPQQPQQPQQSQQLQPESQQPQQSLQQHREQPSLPQMSGGQEEFRRNFRGDAPSFQFNPQASFGFQPPNGPPQFPQPPQGFVPPPGFPGPGFVPPGFPMGPNQGHDGYQRNNRSRNGPYQPRQNQQYNPIRSIRNELSIANKCLVIEGIPEEKLNESSIREYFGRFGNVSKVTLHDKQSMAEVEFEAHDQAVAAHKCPDPIFDNRFVKVFWRKRLPQEEEPEPDIDAVRRMQAIKQQQFQEKEAKRKELTANLREVMTMQAKMLGEKQELLKSENVTAELIQEHQQRYDQIAQEAQRLKNELSQLSGNASAPPGRGGYRGGYRGRARGGSPYGQSSRGSFRGQSSNFRGGYSRGGFTGASLDRRPKGVQLDGITPDKDEILRSRLAASNYTDYHRDGENAVIVDFADRKSAEDFYNTVHDITGLGQNVQKRYVQTSSAGSEKDSNVSGNSVGSAMDES